VLSVVGGLFEEGRRRKITQNCAIDFSGAFTFGFLGTAQSHQRKTLNSVNRLRVHLA
jgi:hypothetical protein